MEVWGAECGGRKDLDLKHLLTVVQKCNNDEVLLGFVCTRPTGLQLAVFAFEDVPVGSRVAHRADPLD
jgi:hypothetical protein